MASWHVDIGYLQDPGMGGIRDATPNGYILSPVHPFGGFGLSAQGSF